MNQPSPSTLFGRRLFLLLATLATLSLGIVSAESVINLAGRLVDVMRQFAPNVSPTTFRRGFHLIVGTIGVLLLGACHRQFTRTGVPWTRSLLRTVFRTSLVVCGAFAWNASTLTQYGSWKEALVSTLLLVPLMLILTGACLEVGTYAVSDRLGAYCPYFAVFWIVGLFLPATGTVFSVFPTLAWAVVPFCATWLWPGQAGRIIWSTVD